MLPLMPSWPGGAGLNHYNFNYNFHLHDRFAKESSLLWLVGKVLNLHWPPLISPQGEGCLTSTVQGWKSRVPTWSPLSLWMVAPLLYENQSLDPTFSFVFCILACEWSREGTLLQPLGSQRLGSLLGLCSSEWGWDQHLFSVFFLKLSYFWLHWIFIAALGLSLVTVIRVYSPVAVCGLLIAMLPSLQSMGCRVRGLSSCGLWAQLPRGIWDLPRPEIKPTSPALAGRLFNGPPGKPYNFLN